MTKEKEVESSAVKEGEVEKKKSRKPIYVVLVLIIVTILVLFSIAPIKRQICISKHSDDYDTCLVIKEKNVTGCNGKHKDFCIFLLYTYDAFEKNDSSICQEMGVLMEDKTLIIICESIINKNDSVCDTASSEEEKDNCKELVSGWGESFVYTYEPALLHPSAFYYYLALFDKVRCPFLKELHCPRLGGESNITTQASTLRVYPPHGYK